MKKEIDELKEQVNKLQEELNERRGIEKSDVESSVRVPELDREYTEDARNSETVEQSNGSSNETIGQSEEPSTESENNGRISLRNDPTDSKQLDDTDDMDSFMSLIPESGEYSTEEVETVKNDKEPTMELI